VLSNSTRLISIYSCCSLFVLGGNSAHGAEKDITIRDLPQCVSEAVIGIDQDRIRDELRYCEIGVLDGATLTIGQPMEYQTYDLKFNHLELKNGARIITNGHNVRITCLSLSVSGSGSIVAFADEYRRRTQNPVAKEGERGLNGRDAGEVTLHVVDEFVGRLTIDLQGQNGQNGGPGTQGTDGLPGTRGNDGVDGLFDCRRGGGDGESGRQGGSGGPGQNGGNGGDGGRLILRGRAEEAFDDGRLDSYGDGGSVGQGGPGGKGGPGGLGGPGGGGSTWCHGGHSGPRGLPGKDNQTTGNRGAEGDPGIAIRGSGARIDTNKTGVPYPGTDCEILVRENPNEDSYFSIMVSGARLPVRAIVLKRPIEDGTRSDEFRVGTRTLEKSGHHRLLLPRTVVVPRGEELILRLVSGISQQEVVLAWWPDPDSNCAKPRIVLNNSSVGIEVQ